MGRKAVMRPFGGKKPLRVVLVRLAVAAYLVNRTNKPRLNAVTRANKRQIRKFSPACLLARPTLPPLLRVYVILEHGKFYQRKSERHRYVVHSVANLPHYSVRVSVLLQLLPRNRTYNDLLARLFQLYKLLCVLSVTATLWRWVGFKRL